MQIPVFTVVSKKEEENRHEPAALNGWKPIASELDRSVRTVQRWERTLGMPIRRVGNGARAPVLVYKEELRRWLLKAAVLRFPLQI
jgi:hypothetical protein